MKTKKGQLSFHHVHGSDIQLSEGGNVATRSAEHFCNGIVFSSKPIDINSKVCIELGHISDWSGAVRIGVTTQNPDKMVAGDLPQYACPDLTNCDGYWARAISEKYADSGNRITFYVNSVGQMHYFVNNEHKGLLLNQLPTNCPLWLLLDIYGNTKSLQFVLPDEAPVEIVARGPDAMVAYHQACESGTQPVFKTRLMLVGQDRVGKTSLKKSLTGQRHNKSELSTDGIDLSASCSFNLRDRTAWKLAMSGNTVPNEHEKQVTGCPGGLEEEYHQALASNIVQELLYRQRQRDKDSDVEPADNQVSSQTEIKMSRAQLQTKESLQALEEFSSDFKFVQEMPERVVQLIEAKLKERAQRPSSGSKKVYGEGGQHVMLNIWDFAGQAVYYTTHQVFLTSRAVYVIVFNMCHDLDDKANTQLWPSEQQGDSQEDELSNLDYMDYWMSSIHAHTAQNTRNSIENTTLSPPIFIVGTHRNSLSSDPDLQEQMVEEKFDQIREHLVGKPYQRHVVNTFYAVENSLTDSEDDEIMKLRRHIEDIASKQPYIGEQMPIKWLKFEQAVSKLVDSGVNFVSFDQIREVANEEGVSTDKELETMLEFYHDLGVLIYYGNSGTLDSVLQSTVILQPKWLVDMFKTLITVKSLDQQWAAYMDSWERLDKEGILEERLVDHLWRDIPNERPALLGLMEKFDLICPRLPPLHLKDSPDYAQKSFYVPSRLKNCPSVDTTYTCKPSDVIFYLCFNGFLPEGLFHRVLVRGVKWSQENGSSIPQLYYRHARFFLDNQHDFVLEMAPVKDARIKVAVLRVAVLGNSNYDSQSISSLDKLAQTPPDPSACAKVRHFLDNVLSDLRTMWVRRISYRTSVECFCDKRQTQGLHFLNLDECLANKVVLCDHRRIKTTLYSSWFPAPVLRLNEGPILPETLIQQVDLDHSISIEKSSSGMPPWTKSAAKLLNGGSEGQDWTALAKRLGYKKNKIEKIGEDLNPGLALIADWIILSGNTALSVDMVISYLEQMHRDDIVQIIQKGQESDVEPPQVFLSYQWDSQDEVRETRDKLERVGFTCWMDIGQMGGGDQLYNKIDEGIRKAKVVLACITPKYIVSHHCHRELNLADLLRKPIIPIMYEKVPWPPPGGMSLMLSQLVYVNMKGVGGHGGAGIHADLAERYNEIIQKVARYSTPARVKSSSNPSLKQSEKQNTGSDSSLNESSSNYETTPEPPMYPELLNYNNNPVLQRTPPVRQSSNQSRNPGEPVRTNTVEQVHVTKCAVCNIL